MDVSAAVDFCTIPLGSRYFRVGSQFDDAIPRNPDVTRAQLKNATLLQVHVVSGGLGARDGGFVIQAPLSQ